MQRLPSTSPSKWLHVLQATGAPLPSAQQQQQQQQIVQSARAATGEADEVPDEVEEQVPYIQDDDYVG